MTLFTFLTDYGMMAEKYEKRGTEMPGFYITNCKPVLPENVPEADCIREQMQVDEFFVCRNTRRQFLNDKLFYQNEKYAVILEGVILNKRELMEKYTMDSYEKLVEFLIDRDPQGFCEEFRGMFSGAVYHKQTKKWTVFSDHIGNRLVLYYVKDGKVIIGSQLNYITDTMKANALERKLSRVGAEQFISYGCFLDESTWVEDVKRILPSDAIRIQDGTVSVYTYHTFRETSNEEISDEEAIARLDEAFCRAVRRGLDKDREYGYTDVIDISGGADSRMIAYTAKRLGAENAILAHYSQSGTNEMKVALEIANKLDLECYVYALDSAKFLMDAQRVIRMSSGTAYSAGITGGERLLRALTGRNPGLEFTGLLGDIQEGAMIDDPMETTKAPTMEYRRFLVEPERGRTDLPVSTLNRFRTNNMFWLFVRGMLCGMSTFFTRQNYAEPYTPYGDVDFLDTIQSIPLERLTGDKIQIKWMMLKYPEAARIAYAVDGLPLQWHLKRWYPLARRYAGYWNRVVGKLTGLNRTNMNPFWKWDREKPWLREWSDPFFAEVMEQARREKLADSQMLDRVEQLYHGNPHVRYYGITTAACWKEFLL